MPVDITETTARLNEVAELRAEKERIDKRISDLLVGTIYEPVPSSRFMCLRCGYGDTMNGQPEWISYSGRVPKSCSRCHSTAWMDPPTSRSRRPSDPPNPKWRRYAGIKSRTAHNPPPASVRPPAEPIIPITLRRFEPPRAPGLPPPPPATRLSPQPRIQAMVEEDRVDEVMLARQMPSPRMPDEPEVPEVSTEPELSEEDRLCNCGERPHLAGCAVFEPPPLVEETNAAG